MGSRYMGYGGDRFWQFWAVAPPGAEAVLGFPGRQKGRAGAVKKHRVNQTYPVILNIYESIHLDIRQKNKTASGISNTLTVQTGEEATSLRAGDRLWFARVRSAKCLCGAERRACQTGQACQACLACMGRIGHPERESRQQRQCWARS